MRGKTILILLFTVSVIVAGIAFVQTMPKGSATAPKEQILVTTMPLAAGTLLRAQDVTWQGVSETEPDETVRPNAATLEAKPELDDETRASVYGAVLRHPLILGEPIRRGAFVKPGDRDFLQVVLSPGARAIAIPVSTGGASTGLLQPGDRVDVILTQNFKNDSNTEMRNTPLTRRSVGETIVENLRVLAIDAPDTKPNGGAAVNPANGNFGRMSRSKLPHIRSSKSMWRLNLVNCPWPCAVLPVPTKADQPHSPLPSHRPTIPTRWNM
jgi:pilus assembly protein CpaB